MNTYAIQTDTLTRDFAAVRAVDNLSIQVPTGSIFGFLGPNGSGKTTTIRLLLGLLEPTHGKAQVLGFDTLTQADQIRSNCGALLEHHGLYERLSAQDNLEYFARIYRLEKSQRAARIQELLSNMGLWERRNEAVGGWSRGMKQKLAVARALLHRPRLIFLDEPTNGLDPVAAVSLREDLASLAEKEGVTVFLTTHNLAEAEKLCHLIGVIRNGKLLEVGAPDKLSGRGGKQHVEIFGKGFAENIIEELRQRPEVVSAGLVNNHLRLEVIPNSETAPLVSHLVSQGVEIEEVRREKASLEEVFLMLMEEEK